MDEQVSAHEARKGKTQAAKNRARTHHIDVMILAKQHAIVGELIAQHMNGAPMLDALAALELAGRTLRGMVRA